MLLSGIDVGISSAKACVVNAENQGVIACVQYPDGGWPGKSMRTGGTGQSPDTGWQQMLQALAFYHKKSNYALQNISTIGIAYHIHQLILTGKEQKILRDGIIWSASDKPEKPGATQILWKFD